MIDTTSEYKTAILSASRDIKPRVEIYFDGDNEAATILASDNIAGIDLLEEQQAEGTSPLGVVSSNEIALTLRNDESQFCPNNPTGPYYGKLLPRIKVVPYYGLKVGESYEWIPLGIYRTEDWIAPSGEAFATVICNDLLLDIGEKDIPLIPTMHHVTQYTMFETLFKAIGLASDDYNIDATLTTEVPIAYYPKGKVRTALTYMAEAFNCTVAVDREGKIKVASNSTVGSSVVTFTDVDMIFTSNMPQKFEEIYSEVALQYVQHIVQPLQSVLKLEDVAIPAAGITLENLAFSKAPVAFVGYIRLSGATHLSIGSLSVGTWGMTIQIDNSASADLVVDIEVFAHPIELTADTVEVRDDAMYSKVGSKKLSIRSYLIQESAQATITANKILVLVKDPSAYVLCSTRGDMSLELCDTITVSDATNKLGTIEIVPIRYKYYYDGGLGCEILGIKKSIREAS